MFQGRLSRTLCICLLSVLAAQNAMIGSDVGAAPRLSQVLLTPSEPTIADDFNVSIVLSEPPVNSSIQYCGPGEWGLCYPPEPFSKGDNDTAYFKSYENGTFSEGVYHFLMDVEFPSSVFIHHEFNITFKPAPTSITLQDLSPMAGQPVSLFPNQTFAVMGRVENDLSEPVSGAWVNLSIVGSGTSENITSDVDGYFTSSIVIADSGSYLVSLFVTDPLWRFSTSASWPVTVSDWPLPAIALEASLIYDQTSSPPGSEGYALYTGSELSLNYSYENTGTGTALNFTIVTNISGSESESDPWNLSNGTYLNGSMELPTGLAGAYTVLLNCTYDQVAPMELKGEEPGAFFGYTIVDRPSWEAHRVLVEMFTQTTCVPCVNVEEALESFHDLEPSLFEFVMYVIDDDSSAGIASGRGVTGTPHVFIDGNFDQMLGGGEVVDVIASLNSTIVNASRRIAPPLGISMTRENVNYSAEVSLSEDFTDDVSGYLVVSSVESYSNLRNNQGIPVRNRYSDEVARSGRMTLSPGGAFALTNVTIPGPGMDLIAVFYDVDGSVLQVKRTMIVPDPFIYLRKETPVTQIEGLGSDSFNITVESFLRVDPGSETDLEPMIFNISIGSLAQGLYVKDLEGDPIDGTGKEYVFDLGKHELLDCGRTRFYDELTFDVFALNDTERTVSFQILVSSSEASYSNSVVLIQTESKPISPFKIVSYSLIGEGVSIYFTATVLNLPDGAKLIGTVRPSTTAGSSGQTGAPVTVILTAMNDTYYKAPVIGLDLTTYDHLVFSLKAELGAMVLNQTLERTVLISDIVKVDDGEDDEDDDQIIIIAFAICALIVVFAIIVIIFFIIRKKEGPTEEDHIEGPEPIGPEDTVTGPTTDDGIGEVPLDQDTAPSEEKVDDPTAPDAPQEPSVVVDRDDVGQISSK